MRYVMMKKMLSLTDRFLIQDEQAKDVYQIRGKYLSLGWQYLFEDMAGNPVASIRQKLLSLVPAYKIYRGDQLIAVIRRRLFSVSKCGFVIDVQGLQRLEVTGDFYNDEYRFTRAGEPVASVRTQWVSSTDGYAIDIVIGEDESIILASAVVIHTWRHGH